MFEERDGLSDRVSAVRSLVEKSPLNPNEQSSQHVCQVI